MWLSKNKTLSKLLQSLLQDVPNVPQHISFFTRVKGDMHRMMVDEKRIIEVLNELSRIIDIGKILFSLMLEKCESVDVKPKKNVLLKIMDSEISLHACQGQHASHASRWENYNRRFEWIFTNHWHWKDFLFSHAGEVQFCWHATEEKCALEDYRLSNEINYYSKLWL